MDDEKGYYAFIKETQDKSAIKACLAIFKNNLLKSREHHLQSLRNPNLTYHDYCCHQSALDVQKKNLMLFHDLFSAMLEE